LPGAVLALSLLAATAPSASSAASADLAPTLTSAERAELVVLLEQARDETLELVRSVRGEDWSHKPGEGRWSVADVVEHIVLAEAVIRQNIDEIMGSEVDPDWPTIDAISLSAILGPIADRSKKFQAPEPIQPKGQLSRQALLDRLRSERQATIDWVRTTDAPLKSHTGMSPFGQTASARHWIAFIAGHNGRHNQQIAEILEG
jgi:uncharacterized damage-inducible protein DinB